MIFRVECREAAKHQIYILFWDNSISGLAVTAQAVKRNVQLPKSIYDDEYRRLINVLRKARISAGLTQQEIAERLRRPQSYVAKVEGCERRLDVIEFVHLCRAIGVEPVSTLEAIVLPKT
ncbi:MAG: helix-turn-helix transcriptional regulator [Pseudomonadota bacterium]